MKLNKKQKRAAYELPGNALISASPGSGKTRTLVARALHKLDTIPKYKTIALITYTNAGADEIVSRLTTEKDLFVGTIHSFCLEYILRPFGWIYNWPRPQVISYEQQKEFFIANDDIKLDVSFGQNKFEELGKIKRCLDGSLNTDVDWNHARTIESVADIYYNYQAVNKVIDFNEILYRSYKIVSENSFIAKSLSSKFYEILVDEFQDTNLYQYEILKQIHLNGNCTFFMVGDDKQQIFSFAGAIECSFDKATSDFIAVNEELNETYRSTNNIVQAYSTLYKDHPEIINKSQYNNLNIKIELIQTEKSNHYSCLDSVVNYLVTDQEIPLSEIAVLSTSWYSEFPASKSLRSKYNVVGLGALPHKSISNSSIGLLKSLSRFYLSGNIRNLRSVKRNIEMHLLENGLTFSELLIHTKTNRLISKFIELPCDYSLEDGFNHVKGIFNTIFEFQHSAFDEILNITPPDEKPFWSFFQYIRTLASIDGITSTTIHKVKGMEYEAVILNEMNENRIPYQKCICNKNWIYESLTEESIEIGRKLFYVAVSRARKHLIILHNWKPSIFVQELRAYSGR